MATLRIPRGNGIKIRLLQSANTVMENRIVEDSVFYNEKEECGDFYPFYSQPILCNEISRFQFFYDGSDAVCAELHKDDGTVIGIFTAQQLETNYYFVEIDWSTIPGVCDLDCLHISICLEDVQILDNEEFESGLAEWDQPDAGDEWFPLEAPDDYVFVSPTPNASGESKTLTQTLNNPLPIGKAVLFDWVSQDFGMGSPSVFDVQIWVNVGLVDEEMIFNGLPQVGTQAWTTTKEIQNIGFKYTYTFGAFAGAIGFLKIKLFCEFVINGRSEPISPTTDDVCYKQMRSFSNDDALQMKFPFDTVSQLDYPFPDFENYTQIGTGALWDELGGVLAFYPFPAGASETKTLTTDYNFKKGEKYKTQVQFSCEVPNEFSIQIFANVGEVDEVMLKEEFFVDEAGPYNVDYEFSPNQDYYNVGFKMVCTNMVQHVFLGITAVLSVFEVWSQTMTIPMTLRSMKPTETSRVFTDSVGKKHKLTSRAEKTYQLVTDYMPDYMVEGMHIAMQNDYFDIKTVNDPLPIEYVKEGDISTSNPERFSLTQVTSEINKAKYNERNDHC